MVYWHPKHKEAAVIDVATLSDAMNHTSQAEIETEKAMLKEVLDNFPDFKDVWECAGFFVDHYDQGKHY